MPTPRQPFAESLKTPIRDLGLRIEGTELEPILREFEAELASVGVRIRPRFYLSTEWGVPFGTVAMALPFYLARPDLTELHAEKVGHVEGLSKADILRYLRHEMGHVINYAYRLYDREEWVQLFGAITQPYLEDYRPSPFSRRYVRHLPGWYAQKHPDEDWSETFAVWMTSELARAAATASGAAASVPDWRTEYSQWPTALAKLEYCDRTMKDLAQRDPPLVAEETDEDVRDLPYSLEQFYERINRDADSMPHGLAGSLRAIFDTLREEDEAEGTSEDGEAKAERHSLPAAAGPTPDGQERKPVRKGHAPRPASVLLKKMERSLTDDVFRWTGHFPERTRILVRHLVALADQLALVYPEDREREAMLAVTTLVTALAMNHVHTGSYLP